MFEIFHIKKLFCFPRVIYLGITQDPPTSFHNTPFYSPLPIFYLETSQGYTKSNTLSKNRQMNNKQNYKML